jgi:DNA (cytosine-5)-methyltransferase 1
VTEPLHTVQAGGLHYGEVRAFLATYYGTDQNTGHLADPLATICAKDRFALVTVEGVEYAIVDIGMRMLAPRELYRAQGFPDSYRIDIEYNGKPMTKTAQVRMCGNSVCPPLAAAIVAANANATTFIPGLGRERVA